ncbi:N-acetylglucosamine-6-phosphate deacetylase [Gracilaria domingensis]|nr:N-acetylglucosamine-6-phosphate deacetylase [Gracilaria domingensis]
MEHAQRRRDAQRIASAPGPNARVRILVQRAHRLQAAVIERLVLGRQSFVRPELRAQPAAPRARRALRAQARRPAACTGDALAPLSSVSLEQMLIKLRRAQGAAAAFRSRVVNGGRCWLATLRPEMERRHSAPFRGGGERGGARDSPLAHRLRGAARTGGEDDGDDERCRMRDELDRARLSAPQGSMVLDISRVQAANGGARGARLVVRARGTRRWTTP